MEENREPLSAIAIEKKLQLLRNKHFSEDTIALVKSDYEYGLKEEEISLYLNKSYDIEQMKILSECLHKDVPKDVIDIIKNTKYSVHQMQVSLEFYEKGVPVQTIKEVMDKGEKPITMRRLYEEVLEQLNKVKKQIPEESEYVKALISQMDEVVEKINHQNERYDALNKKLSEIETSKDDEEVRERLVKENQDKDALINSQQNELNKASSTIARLRDDIEKKDKEMKRMGDRIESLEDKIISVATENKKEAESKAEPQESQSVPQAEKKMVDTVAVPQNMQAVANGIPVYYQIPVVDGTGNVVQRLPIERSVRKSSNSGVASLFARLSFKKKSRADIVKLVASGNLVPAQLVQIKSAIEKGLTETQLIELITNNISAEKMKEIIEIAVLENSISKMKDIDKGGSRIAIIHNGSPLFTGDAGSGPSEIRRYILENDLLEAIIALPNDIFYNTGIATYIWVLSNKKAGTVREGKVQLINANEMYVKRRKALGNKRNDISEEDIAEITKIYGDFKESEISQIYDNEDFGYTKITVERPLRDEEGNLVLKKGKKQPDTSLRDTENVPLKEDIKEYFEREVLPFAPDAWIDEKKSKVGYEIPFTRYFYKYEAPRPSAEIMAEIMDLETELSGSLEEVFDL